MSSNKSRKHRILAAANDMHYACVRDRRNSSQPAGGMVMPKGLHRHERIEEER